MTTFQIDTGVAERRIDAWVPGWFRDQYDVEPDEARLAHDWAYHMIGALNNHKMMKTVRSHVVAQWGFLQLLADMHPDLFDEFWASYAERWQAS